MSRDIESYGVYLADLDPTRGSEIAKTRPVVVVSRAEMNRNANTVVVLPINHQPASALAQPYPNRLRAADRYHDRRNATEYEVRRLQLRRKRKTFQRDSRIDEFC